MSTPATNHSKPAASNACAAASDQEHGGAPHPRPMSKDAGAPPRGTVLWLTGLPASGKTTIARALEAALRLQGIPTYVLDGDDLRAGLCRDLGYAPRDRSEGVRRVSEVARLMADAGLCVIVACIAPFAKDRRAARERLQSGRYFEVYIDCPLAICRARDPKGLYARAGRGELTDLTGLDSPYEAPVDPDLHLCTGDISVEAAVAALLDLISVAKR